MKWGIAIVAVILTGSWLASPPGFGEPRQDLKDFMRVKLKHSQTAMEGLVLDDFDKIAKSAQEMSLLSLAETWQVLNTPEYLDYSRKFRNAADTLADSARKKNLDQCVTAFNQMTAKCVQCHKYLRDVRMAEK